MKPEPVTFVEFLNGQHTFDRDTDHFTAEMVAGKQGAEGHISFEWNLTSRVTPEGIKAFPHVFNSRFTMDYHRTYGTVITLIDVENNDEQEREFYEFLEAVSGNCSASLFEKWFPDERCDR